jgi:hypothetical protein
MSAPPRARDVRKESDSHGCLRAASVVMPRPAARERRSPERKLKRNPERGRGLAQVAPGPTRRVAKRQRPSTGRVPRWTLRACRQIGGRRDRAESNGSRQTGLEAPCAGRRARGAPCGAARPGERTRLQAVRGSARQRAPGARPTRTATEATRQAPRRQRLRLPSLPTSLLGPRHRGADRTAWSGIEGATRSPSLGRGEDAGLASPIPAPRRSLRAPARHPPRVPPPRLRAHLVQIRGEVLSGFLNRRQRGPRRSSAHVG